MLIIKDTEENIMRTFLSDTIGRNKYLLNLLNIISIYNNGVFTIEGEWGSGKTFFVKQLKYIYENSNKISTFKNENVNVQFSTIDPKLYDNVDVLYYDAWKHDNVSDPLISIVYEIINKFNYFHGDKKIEFDKKEFINKTLETVKNEYKIFKLFQILVESINLEKNEIDNLIEGIKKEKTNEELVYEIISNISNENKLIIIIDELDRCKPDFALKILEEIKHFFDIKNVIFLIVINPNEIANVIKKYYGANINSDLYLDKIIDNRLILPNINTDEYIENILFNCNCQSQLIKIMIQDISKYYNFELRQINHFILLVKNIFPNFKLQISMFDELDNILSIAKFFALNGVVIILIGTYLHDYNLYKKMINNKAKNEFKDIVIYSNDILNYFKLRKNLLNDDIEKNFLPIKNIEYLYDCFFNNSVDYLNSDEKKYQIREFGKMALLKCNVLTSLYSFNKNN